MGTRFLMPCPLTFPGHMRWDRSRLKLSHSVATAISISMPASDPAGLRQIFTEERASIQLPVVAKFRSSSHDLGARILSLD